MNQSAPKEIHYPFSVGLMLNGLLNFVGIRPEWGPHYKVIRHDGPIEIREYEAYIIAKTHSSGPFHVASHNNFSALSGYIFGHNNRNEKLEMTSPVFQSPQNNMMDENGWHMGLIMPPGYHPHNLPAPDNSRVRFEAMPAQTVATIRYSGNTNPYVMQTQLDKLSCWLKRHHYQAAGAPRSAQYDPPFTIPSCKRNEIHIPLRPLPPRKKFLNIF